MSRAFVPNGSREEEVENMNVVSPLPVINKQEKDMKCHSKTMTSKLIYYLPIVKDEGSAPV